MATVPEALKTFKPDAEEAARRWQAFYAGELIDRPPVCVTAPRADRPQPPPRATLYGYREKVFDDLDQVVARGLAEAEATFWGGEAFPNFYPSFGPDEFAVFLGADLVWSADSSETNWSIPCIKDWESALPLRLDDDNWLWQRLLELYRRAADCYRGRILLTAPDLHTNMDLLAGLRGPQRLCLDLLECPSLIDRAMDDARALFRRMWADIVQAGQMAGDGFCAATHGLYSQDGSAILQCDFSLMISPTMFRRWVLPALEEEAELVRHVVYHWDGPGALVHTADLLASRGLHTLSFVPGDGHGDPVDHLPLLKRLQDGGKAVHVWGDPAQCQRMHQELRPEKVFYNTSTETQAEAEALLAWFVRHT